MSAASTIHGTDRTSATEAQGPQAPAALHSQGQVPWVHSSKDANTELSCLLSALAQALKFQLLEDKHGRNPEANSNLSLVQLPVWVSLCGACQDSTGRMVLLDRKKWAVEYWEQGIVHLTVYEED